LRIARTNSIPGVLLVLACFTVQRGAILGQAAERPAANVPPTLEIEVLDPNADPLGRPAIELHTVDGATYVDIPPAVLVHRYYYTGDRSFQAQLLPGGPCILVVNHPKTGERCYIEVQMLPGAPRVTYTDHSIQYDYGEHGITLHFGLFGHPSVKYRSGLPWSKKVGQLVHAEQVSAGVHKLGAGVKRGVDAGTESLKEAAIDTHSMFKSASLPVVNLLRMMPLGAAILDPARHEIRDEKIALEQREHDYRQAMSEQRRQSLTIPTNR
jgi:hypothetical protein